MKYFIDSANEEEIQLALQMGVVGITSNPSLYANEKVNLLHFLEKYKTEDVLLTGEVIGNHLTELYDQAQNIQSISDQIILKLNYSAESLQFIKEVSGTGIITAVTLVFDINQALMSMQAGVDYLFLFVARNEDVGKDGIGFIKNVAEIIVKNGYKTKIIAASLRNQRQLEQAALYADYAAVPYLLIEDSFRHSLTVSGNEKFQKDLISSLEVASK
ncbi:transaldolase family protein [Bacillus sp. FJAT-50079]|uniref:transaldolase family protein n=1 Tax=Bacillus sp. FJAT-50079 TaxID=2833577 RepID=UPI001BC9B313|nr:hypothetical protein [Bacillus sp. FJAT-50079]